MTAVETLILATYFFVLLILAVYGWHRYYLVYVYMKHKHEQPRPKASFDTLPVVTIQLPLYNEMYVADRLIEAVCAIEYPRELLEIQVLDDSVDETRAKPRSSKGRARKVSRRRSRAVSTSSSPRATSSRSCCSCLFDVIGTRQ